MVLKMDGGVKFSWTVGSASTIEKTETCCSLNALLQF